MFRCPNRIFLGCFALSFFKQDLSLSNSFFKSLLLVFCFEINSNWALFLEFSLTLDSSQLEQSLFEQSKIFSVRMFVPFQFRCKPLMLQCPRAFLLSHFITPKFLLLHCHIKTSFSSLAFFLSWSFWGVSSEIIILFLSVFMYFARLMMFSAIYSGISR